MQLLKKLRVKPSLISIIMIVLSFCYLAITGFSISAMRSVIMLNIVYLSMLSSVPSDSLTALSIAGIVIILISPGSIIDSGFWMSFSATLGILSYMPACTKFTSNALYQIKNNKRWVKIGTSIITAFAAGIFAIIPLIIVLCIFIQESSLFTVLSSALLSIPTSLILILSLIFLPVAKIPYVSYAVSFRI